MHACIVNGILRRKRKGLLCQWVALVMPCTGMLDRVREMLRGDPDPMVVSNCMSVIQQVQTLGAMAE